MFLGVLLHASLSFTGGWWIIRDKYSAPWLDVFVSGVHGFRMELFFLVSGFFTAMLCKRRGVAGMLKNRALRILIPCVLGVATVGPLAGWVIKKYNPPAAVQIGASFDAQPESELIRAVLSGHREEVAKILREGGDASEADKKHGMRLLTIAAYAGHTDIVRLLLDSGADVNQTNRSGGRPLHAAALAGKDDIAELLLQRGADTNVKNGFGNTPLETTHWNEENTRALTDSIGIPPGAWPEVEKGRARVRELLAKRTASSLQSPPKTWLVRYQEFLGADFWWVRFGNRQKHLIYDDIFGHLWFLRDLCWLFVLYAAAARTGMFSCLSSGARLSLGAGIAIAVALSVVTNIPMHLKDQGGFGPDTSTGLVPTPHLLIHYAVYFFFGAFYHSHAAQADCLGRFWPLWLGIALFVLLPAGLHSVGNRWRNFPVVAAYSWLAIAGLMGFFQRYLGSESTVVRYLSDSSYWCYLTHMVFVFALQGLVRNWQLPAIVKFALVAVSVIALLLASYHVFVRRTPLGWLLNGLRKG